MIDILTQTLPDAAPRLRRFSLIRLLRPFAATLPTFYLLSVIPFALLGYAALLLFPALTAWLYFEMIGLLYTTQSYQHWPDVLLPGISMLVTGLISISLLKIRFKNPAGFEVSDQKMPRLFGLVHDLQWQYGKPKISKVVITRDENIKVTRIPVNWFPIRFRNTLQIGLPVLLCSTPIQFKGMLAREIAGFSCPRNPVTGWLLKLNGQWADYRKQLERNPDFLIKPLAIFFRYYSPWYNEISFFAARRAEIRADRYMLEVMEDDDVIMSLMQSIIFQHFLKEKYWPRVNQQPKNINQKLFLPYRKMTRTIRKNIRREDVQRWIETELNRYGDTSTSLPPLKTRLWLLGHEKPLYPPALRRTAAEKYLDESMVTILAGSFDRSWSRQGGFGLEN